jgi:hypothetical protein
VPRPVWAAAGRDIAISRTAAFLMYCKKVFKPI